MEGGIAYFPGRSSPITIDSDELPKQESDELKGLVNATHFFDLPKVIGSDPNNLAPGEVIYIPAIVIVEKTCTVTSSSGLNVRAAPNTQSSIVNRFPQGTVLTFFEVVNGENVQGNPRWGHSDQGYY